MSDKHVVSVTELRQNMSLYVDQVNDDETPVTIIRHSRPAAVMVSYDTYRQLKDYEQQLSEALERMKK